LLRVKRRRSAPRAQRVGGEDENEEKFKNQPSGKDSRINNQASWEGRL